MLHDLSTPNACMRLLVFMYACLEIASSGGLHIGYMSISLYIDNITYDICNLTKF